MDLRAIQALILFITVAGVLIWVVWIRRNRRQWRYAVPPLSWLAHVLLFYSAVLLEEYGIIPAGLDFALWEDVLLLQAGFLIVGIGLVLLLERMMIRS